MTDIHDVDNNETDDIAMHNTDEALQAGIAAGNINIRNADDQDDEFDLSVMSAQAHAAQQKHEDVLRSLEEKRLKQNLRVPTDDNEVKQRLRALAKPICYFGEQAADRRDRLRDLIAKMIADGESIPEFRKDRRQLEIDLASIADKINKDRPYFSAGNPWIKVARTKILKYSLQRASQRVSVQLKQRECPMPSAQAQRQQTEALDAALSSLKCQASYYDHGADARPLQCCALSPYLSDGDGDVDGDDARDKYAILFGTQSGDITLWNEQGRMKQRIRAHEDRITGLDIQPAACRSWRELRFLSASADGLLKLWDLEGQQLHCYDALAKPDNKKPGSGAATGTRRHRLGKCAFHPMGGEFFVSTSYDRSWCFWDVQKATSLLLRQDGHSTSVHCCAFHPDGSLLATGDLGGIVRLWDLRSGRAILGFDSHAKSVLDVAFNCNGYIMATCSMDNTVKIWDLRKLGEYTIPAHDNLISAIQFEPHKGEWLASVSYDKTVRIWSMKKRSSFNFKLTHEMKGHHSRISGVCISDGIGYNQRQFIVTASHDKTWKIWAHDDFVDLENEHRQEKIEQKVKMEPLPSNDS